MSLRACRVWPPPPHFTTQNSRPVPKAQQSTCSFSKLPVFSWLWFCAIADFSARKFPPLDLHMVCSFLFFRSEFKWPFTKKPVLPTAPLLCVVLDYINLPAEIPVDPSYSDVILFVCWWSLPTKCKDKNTCPYGGRDLAPSRALRPHPGTEQCPQIMSEWMNISYNERGFFQLQTLHLLLNRAIGACVGGLSPPSPHLPYRSGVTYNHPDQLSSVIKPEHPHKSSFQNNSATNFLVARNPRAVDLHF